MQRHWKYAHQSNGFYIRSAKKNCKQIWPWNCSFLEIVYFHVFYLFIYMKKIEMFWIYIHQALNENQIVSQAFSKQTYNINRYILVNILFYRNYYFDEIIRFWGKSLKAVRHYSLLLLNSFMWLMSINLY